MNNILTIDLEDYYQVSAFEGVVKREDWDKYESRVERNTCRVLDILSDQESLLPSRPSPFTPDGADLPPLGSNPRPPAGPRATFFVLGWVAERFPRLIREVHQQGYEIASHGYDHRAVYDMSPVEFREDVRKSKKILEDICGFEIIGYRAPSYSITKKSLWALEILAEEGYRYDSSIFPIYHDRYGIPDAPRFPFAVCFNGKGCVNFSDVLSPGASSLRPRFSDALLEFPISTVGFFGQNIPVSGGGYFRLLPYSFVRLGLKRINEVEGRPFTFYLHPWEMDSSQPRIQGAGVFSRLRHYSNLAKTEMKFRELLKEFSFSSMRDISELII